MSDWRYQGVREVNTADRTDFTVHRVLDARVMELVAAGAATKARTSTERFAVTAEAGIVRVCVDEDSNQSRREDQRGCQERHAGRLSPRCSQHIKTIGPDAIRA